MKQNDALESKELFGKQHFTQPPPRYSEALLVRELEAKGIGRPSTYAQIIDTLKRRNYVLVEKRRFTPTEVGYNVKNMLVRDFEDLFSVSFTAKMEQDLDKIESGEVGWVKVMSDFYSQFVVLLEKAKPQAADTQSVTILLQTLQKVSEFNPPQKIGRRTYDDKKYIQSVGEQLEKGERPISQKQLLALGRLIVRYKDQIPDAPEVLERLGLSELLQEEKYTKPKQSTIQKLELLKKVTFSEQQGTFSEKSFVESLHTQVENQRALSPKQSQILDRIVLKYSEQVPDFDAIAEDLGFSKGAGKPDEQILLMLQSLQKVGSWAEPVQRGKRTFDDKAFFTSLQEQFKERKLLSPRQKSSLKRLVKKYQSQIPDYKQLAEKMGITS